MAAPPLWLVAIALIGVLTYAPFDWRSLVSGAPAMVAIGQHRIAEFNGVAADMLNDERLLKAMMEDSATAGNFTALGEARMHSFSPHGVTGLLLLAESHISIHTWPEHGYAAVDVFTCGNTCDPAGALANMQKILKPTHTDLKVMDRGYSPAHVPSKQVKTGSAAPTPEL